MKHKQESRISGFHRLSIADRQEELARRWDLNPEEMADLRNEAPLALSRAAQLTENTVGIYALPMGVALNFRVDGEDRLVPMVTEEPSVIAAASNAARLALDGGGFRAESDPSSMIAQIQLVDVPDPEQAKASIEAASGTLMARIDAL
ncbi:MAG: 3-hydroxy-3-methylglutaryl-CoA reductase, partial [Candidatus Binatia bacterium]|nr:3-hydroxy-3-methylglutaryl-CoA reductase [Candidatus Binatia bacterium]